MFQVEEIQSFDLPELRPYRTMRRQYEQREQGIFVAEGEKVVRRLLESQFFVISMLMPGKWLAELEPLLQARPESIRVFVAEKELLETLTGFSMYQGLLAVGKIPRQPTLTEILGSSPAPLLLAAVDGVCNAENLGALVRNCVAFNVQALIVGETSSSPFLRRAVRSSMGTIFQLPALETANLAADLRRMQAQGIRCVAAHPRESSLKLWQANLATDCCIVFGSEGPGISEEVLVACNEAVTIPMPTGFDSLNVA